VLHLTLESTIAMNGMTFERDLLSERVKSGLAVARPRGKKLGRQPGQRPKSDKLAPQVVQAVTEGRSYRWIARDIAISKTAVADIVKRHRQNSLASDFAPSCNSHPFMPPLTVPGATVFSRQLPCCTVSVVLRGHYRSH
tara:strand:+ start:400 stop:816 length:417 start_codon:yes stop_codon:yes gene_type:complete